jgi:Tfp pilus assembly protein FimT
VELMIVVLILSILSVTAMDAIATFEANQRADRAARESLAAFRFAKGLAMSTGKKAKVVVDTTASTLSVFWQSNGTAYDTTAYATGMTTTGTWVLNMNNNRELVGTAISLNPTTTTFFEYNALGTSGQTGTVTFTYGTKTKSLVVSNVGDPQLQ